MLKILVAVVVPVAFPLIYLIKAFHVRISSVMATGCGLPRYGPGKFFSSFWSYYVWRSVMWLVVGILATIVIEKRI